MAGQDSAKLDLSGERERILRQGAITGHSRPSKCLFILTIRSLAYFLKKETPLMIFDQRRLQAFDKELRMPLPMASAT